MSPESGDDGGGRLDRLRPSRRSVLQGLGVLGVGVVGTVSDVAAVYVVSQEGFETEKTAPTSEWTVALTSARDSDDVDGDVAALADLPTAVADLLRAAASSAGRAVGRDSLPAGTRSVFDRYAGVTGLDVPGNVAGIALFRNRPDEPPAMAVEADLVDGRAGLGNPAAIELSVRNRDDGVRTLSGGPFVPFGDVYAEPRGDDRTVRLYRRGEPPWHLSPVATGVPAVLQLEPVDPGERLSNRYRLPASDPGLTPGEYRVAGATSSRRGGPDRRPQPPVEVVEWTLDLTVEYGP